MRSCPPPSICATPIGELQRTGRIIIPEDHLNRNILNGLALCASQAHCKISWKSGNRAVIKTLTKMYSGSTHELSKHQLYNSVETVYHCLINEHHEDMTYDKVVDLFETIDEWINPDVPTSFIQRIVAYLGNSLTKQNPRS